MIMSSVIDLGFPDNLIALALSVWARDANLDALESGIGYCFPIQHAPSRDPMFYGPIRA